ncbi:MAG TPA: PAS domain-containing protein [Rhizobiales bacterium]|nr:PAS domain-containing protein [Hyphomicrobiales bacterium]
MKHKKTIELYQYWNKLRGSNAAPKRCDLDPHDIPGLLGDLFILERKTPVRYTFRLAGTRMCAAFGQELRQLEFNSMWKDQDRESIESVLHTITEDASTAILGVQGIGVGGHSLPLEILLLPLYQTAGKLNRIVGIFLPLKSAYWVGNQPLIRQKIRSLRLIMPNEHAEFEKEAIRVNAKTSFGQANPRRTAVNLTVIKGGLD